MVALWADQRVVEKAGLSAVRSDERSAAHSVDATVVATVVHLAALKAGWKAALSAGSLADLKAACLAANSADCLVVRLAGYSAERSAEMTAGCWVASTAVQMAVCSVAL